MLWCPVLLWCSVYLGVLLRDQCYYDVAIALRACGDPYYNENRYYHNLYRHCTQSFIDIIAIRCLSLVS